MPASPREPLIGWPELRELLLVLFDEGGEAAQGARALDRRERRPALLRLGRPGDRRVGLFDAVALDFGDDGAVGRVDHGVGHGVSLAGVAGAESEAGPASR